MARLLPHGPPTPRFHSQNTLTVLIPRPSPSPYRVKSPLSRPEIPAISILENFTLKNSTPLPKKLYIGPVSSSVLCCFLPKQRQPLCWVFPPPNKSLVQGSLCTVTLWFSLAPNCQEIFPSDFSAHKQFLEDLLVPPIAFVFFSSSLLLIPSWSSYSTPSSSSTLIPAHLGHSLLACFSCLASPAFLQHPGSPVQGWHHSQWATPYYINL